jgi:hypothetical protein
MSYGIMPAGNPPYGGFLGLTVLSPATAGILVVALEPPLLRDIAVGTELRVRVLVLDADQRTAIDPGALTIRIAPPYSAEQVYVYGTTAVPVRETLGQYRLDFALGAPGRWRVRTITTGVATASDTTEFYVVESGV